MNSTKFNDYLRVHGSLAVCLYVCIVHWNNSLYTCTYFVLARTLRGIRAIITLIIFDPAQLNPIVNKLPDPRGASMER